MNLTKKVKDLALSNDMDYVGIAPVERFENAPQGHKPTDLLPGAESVVSMGIRLSVGVELSQRIAWSNRKLRHACFSYRWFGYGLLNRYFLDRAAFLLTRLLEGEGHVAVPIVASGASDTRNLIADFSNRHAAVAAGIGEFGWNGLCLTPDVGPRARYVSVITTAKLDPDPMYAGPKLCDPDKCKELGGGQPLCVKVCPVSALSGGSQRVILGKKSFQVAKDDRNRCMWGSEGLSDGSLALKPIPMPDKLELIDVVNALGERDPIQNRELWTIGKGDYCGKCIMVCPVGSPEIVDEIASKGKSKKL